MESVRSVKEIQAELINAREELDATVKRLRLVELMTELERNYPEDMDSELVSEGAICPPLAWEIHGDVGNAKILLEEVLSSLDKGARRTPHDVRTGWLNERLQEIKDPAVCTLLSFLVKSSQTPE